MKYELMPAPVAETACRMEQNANEVRVILAKMQEVITQLTGSNAANELTDFKEIFDGSAMEDIHALAKALDVWSKTLSAIHHAYHKARCDSCQEALTALNKIQ